MNTDNLKPDENKILTALDPYRIQQLQVVARSADMSEADTTSVLASLMNRGLVTKVSFVGRAYYRYSRDYAWEVTR